MLIFYDTIPPIKCKIYLTIIINFIYAGNIKQG